MQAIAVVDLDGDGWEDLAYRDNAYYPYGANLRNVNGVFVIGSTLSVLPDHPAATDFDGDGDQDVIDVNGTLRNRTRQLQNAVPPRLGMNAELVVHAYGGDGVNQQIVLLFLATSLASPPIPIPGLGTQYLDPATTVYHSTHFIAGTGGEATIAYTVPPTPSLLGSAVHAQAGFAHQPAPSSWRLGNHVELRIRL